MAQQMLDELWESITSFVNQLSPVFQVVLVTTVIYVGVMLMPSAIDKVDKDDKPAPSRKKKANKREELMSPPKESLRSPSPAPKRASRASRSRTPSKGGSARSRTPAKRNQNKATESKKAETKTPRQRSQTPKKNKRTASPTARGTNTRRTNRTRARPAQFSPSNYDVQD